MRLDEARRDLYRRLAKERGYRSRAAFKLIQANEKYDFIRPGFKVVDFGAAPGGWVQVCSELVGPKGLVVGVDLAEVRVRYPNVRTLRIDVHSPKLRDAILQVTGGPVDLVLSDLSPSVTGVWQLDHLKQVDMTVKVMNYCAFLLKQGGDAFFKLFEGERSPEVRDEFKTHFKSVRPVKPLASRNEAAELYYFCIGWRGTPSPPADA